MAGGRLINIVIGVSVLATLAYLLYRGPSSALAIHIVWLLVPLVHIERIEAHARQEARFDGAHHASHL